jgi:hypothetical protein
MQIRVYFPNGQIYIWNPCLEQYIHVLLPLQLLSVPLILMFRY